MTSFHIEPPQDGGRNCVQRWWDCITTFLEENRQNIFYLFVFYVITIALFIERFIRKSVVQHQSRQHLCDFSQRFTSVITTQSQYSFIIILSIFFFLRLNFSHPSSCF